ncbi:MAG TPA: sigma-70 family RNA polymerase sigma factor [Solirubrobacteraceae bacterium]|jgi:RNA polymerase sigma-70 factor (ECF subfamily)
MSTVISLSPEVRRPETSAPVPAATAYDVHAGDVFRTAYAILGDAHLAADVTQDVFTRLWARPDRYDASRGELGSYLKLVARSRAIDVWRRGTMGRRLQERLETEPPAAPVVAEDAGELADRRARAAAVRAAVQRLPHAQREAIALTYWGGLSAPEVAARAGVPLGTIKSRIRLGLARLREDAALTA